MKRLIIRAAFLLAGILTVFTLNLKAQDLNSATLLTRSEQYDKAGAMLQQLIQKEPTNSKNYFFLGENYLLDYFADTISNSLAVATKDAKEAYQKGVNANPNDPLNYIGLAKVAFYLGDDKTATEMRAKAKSFLLPYKNIKKIVPAAPDYAFTLAKIAESYIKDAKVDTSLALPLIREAIKIDLKNRDVYVIAGDIYILFNDGSKAIAYYNQAQFADPKSATANMKIGNIYFKAKAFPSAISAFEDAIALNPDYAPAYRELGQLYLATGRYEQSKTNFKKYLDLTAGNIPAMTKYVNALFYAKDYEAVIKTVEEIFAVDKSRSYMNRLAAYSYYEKTPPDYVKALGYMEELFRTLAPERINPKDHLYMARILIKKNQNYTKMVDELNGNKTQLEKDNAKYASVTAAEKTKLKPALDELTTKTENLQKEVTKADLEISRAFVSYDKFLSFNPEDKNTINEIANTNYTFRRYGNAAKSWAKLIDPAKDNTEDLMRIGRAYYNGESYKAADSIFSSIIAKSPDYIPAYLWDANTYTKMDPDTKLGLAKPKFEKLLEVAKVDSVKNASNMMDAMIYLSYYYMKSENYSKSKDYYNRMINLSSNKDYKIRGYSGLGTVELQSLIVEKTSEGRLPYLSRATEYYNKVLAIDPNNALAKGQLTYIRGWESDIKKGINPNEIKGIIKNLSNGQPIAYASVRVKDTAAENMANSKGEFKFEIPQGSEVLIISAKGFKTQEIPITKSRVYNVSLGQ